MKIVVDRERCAGIGMCEATAERYFEVADDGAVHLLTEEVAEQDVTEVEDAVLSCPAQALKLEKE